MIANFNSLVSRTEMGGKNAWKKAGTVGKHLAFVTCYFTAFETTLGIRQEVAALRVRRGFRRLHLYAEGGEGVDIFLLQHIIRKHMRNEI